MTWALRLNIKQVLRLSTRMHANQHPRFVFHPLTFAVLALSIGALAGLGSYLVTRTAKASAGQQPAVIRPQTNPAATNAPKLPPTGSHVAFDATFTGSTLDTSVWSTCYWYAQPGAGCGHFGNYPEQEWYLGSQDQVSNGALNLVASPISTPGTSPQGAPATYQCRSGMVTTDPSFSFTYGYVQVVAQLPKGVNTWPAIWMLPVNTSLYVPEIDIVEVLGNKTNRPLVTFHPSNGALQNLVAKTADLSSGWHTFGLDWEPGSITWYIDGSAVFTVTTNVPSQPMYLLANLAITDVFHPLQLPGSCSATLAIRSVEVWQKASY
jgi:beta-glucanase (GH16 family)